MDVFLFYPLLERFNVLRCYVNRRFALERSGNHLVFFTFFQVFVDRAGYFSRRTDCYGIVGNIPSYDTAGADYYIIPDSHARHNDDAVTNETVIADMNRGDPIFAGVQVIAGIVRQEHGLGRYDAVLTDMQQMRK